MNKIILFLLFFVLAIPTQAAYVHNFGTPTHAPYLITWETDCIAGENRNFNSLTDGQGGWYLSSTYPFSNCDGSQKLAKFYMSDTEGYSYVYYGGITYNVGGHNAMFGDVWLLNDNSNTPQNFSTISYPNDPQPTAGPVYTPDTTVMGAGQGLMGSLVATFLGIIPVGVGITGGLMATLFGVGKLVGWVRGNLHG